MRLTALILALLATVSVEPTVPREPENQQAGLGGDSTGVPISSDSLIVVAPRSRDSVAAWSHHSGVWNRIPIKPGDGDAIVPIVGTGVAGIRIGKMVYGFGAESGKWHWIETENRNAPAVGRNQITVSDGDWYYAISSKSGKWSGINLKTGEIR